MDLSQILQLFPWIHDHWLIITEGYLAIVGLASWIVRLTPTLKDDTILLDITKFVAKYLAINTNAPTSRPTS